MSGWQFIAMCLAGGMAWQWWTKQRIGRVVRRRDRADAKVNDLLKRWF